MPKQALENLENQAPIQPPKNENRDQTTPIGVDLLAVGYVYKTQLKYIHLP